MDLKPTIAFCCLDMQSWVTDSHYYFLGTFRGDPSLCIDAIGQKTLGWL